jgi:hypothetical protein
MDHQPNYTEYTDPSYGNFINSFSGSENYMVPQPEQLNGKTHCEGLQPLTPFDPGNSTAHYNAQPAPMMFHHHLPDPMVPPPQEPTAALYPLDPVAYGDVVPSQPINVLKHPMFDMGNPPSAVPANIIQQESITMQQTEPISLPQPEITQDSQIKMTHPIESSLPTEKEVTEPSETELQQTSTEDLPSEKPQQKTVFSPEQNNMMKALGVVRKEVLAPISGSNKRRRRILQLNDEESDDESELKNEMQLQISPEKDKESAESNAKSEESESDEEKDPKAIKARFLLKSAVIIQGPASKKKKRVLDSDEEDEMQTSVDDIGLMDTNDNENEDDLYDNSDIIVSDAGFDDISEKVVSIENPIIPQDEFVVPAPPFPLTVERTAEIEDDNTPKAIVKTEKVENVSEESVEVKKIIKTEDGEIDPSMSVEAVLENIKPMADDE